MGRLISQSWLELWRLKQKFVYYIDKFPLPSKVQNFISETKVTNLDKMPRALGQDMLK